MSQPIEAIVNEFLKEKPTKRVFGNYRIEGEKLVYRTYETSQLFWEQDKAKEYAKTRGGVLEADKDNETRFRVITPLENTIAVKVNGKVIGNSSLLPYVGRRMAYGNEQLNRSVTPIQTVLSTKALMIPFNVMQEAKLDLQKFEMIEKGPEETLQIYETKWDNYDRKQVKIKVNRHFAGASLFKVDTKTYLFDVDRREVKHGIFNAFLVEVSAKVKTIAEAYESLKPKAVKDAEKRGLEVLRQGEWFFIKAKAPKLPKLSLEQKLALGFSRFGGADNILGKKEFKALEAKVRKLTENVPRQLTLRAGPNRPNSVERGLTAKGQTLCTGKVTHSGREHAELKLEGWYSAVPNTATKSFTITGDVD